MTSSIDQNSSVSRDTQPPVNTSNPPKNEQKVADFSNEKKVEDVPESLALTQKQQLNASIIESSIKFNSTLGDQPLSLVLKTALQGINEALKEMGVDSSVEDAFESGIDFSPEATAERIVSFSTQFLNAYQEQHTDMDEEESLSSFMSIIREGIDKGFDEAKEILTALNVLNGDIADNIDKTYALVQEGLQSFVDLFDANKEADPE